MAKYEENTDPSPTATNEQLRINRFDHAQSLIDLEISHLNESVRALKTRRNEMSPISWLPPELLCKIFELVQQVGPGGSRYNGLSNLFGWTKLTHVSRRWMEIALGDTSLWSNITITGRWPDWEEEVFTRSQCCPISVWVPFGIMDIDNWRTLNLLEKVLLQLQRITTLIIEGLHPFDLHRILSNSNLPPSPLLRSLKLGTSIRESDGSLPTTTFTLFNEIFPDASRLNSLSLSGYGLEWNPFFFSNLVRLKIMNIPVSFRPSRSQVISALKTARNLESLTLMNFLRDSAASQDEVVYLPRLYKLHLNETSAAAARFIPFLSFPDSANVTVNCNSTGLIQSELHSLLSIFNRSSEYGIKKIRHLSLSETLISQDIHAWEESKEVNSPDPIRIPQFQRPADITLSLDPRSLNNTTDPLLRACRIMPLQYLESLVLSPNLMIPPLDWAQVFGPMQYLGWISLGMNSVMPLLHVIVSYNDIILPSLRYLSVKLMPFSRAPSPVPIMEQAFLKRRTQNASMRILTLLDSSHLTPDDTRRLEQVVERVQRDGYFP